MWTNRSRNAAVVSSGLAALLASCTPAPPQQPNATDAGADALVATETATALDAAEAVAAETTALAPEASTLAADTTAASSCAVLPEGSACDDGDPCTSATHCVSGACGGGLNLCMCSTDADCAVFDDPNLCNGTLFCNKKTFPHACAVLGASIVVCSNATTAGCGQEACKPASGKCEKVLANGSPCQDSDPCSVQAACSDGQCVASDANWCQCTSNANCAVFEDGNLCNGSLYCNKAAFPYTCKVNPATVIQCNPSADTACLKNVCHASSGSCSQLAVELTLMTCDTKGCTWQPLPPAAATTPTTAPILCDDGLPCTSGDVCSGGQCQGGTDTCSCTSTADCAKLEDGNWCNGTLFCNKALKPAACVVNPATVVSCANASDTACAKNACTITTGKCDCLPTSKLGSCTLSAVETVQQDCENGACRWQTLPPGSPPTASVACQDGNACTVGDVCASGSCAGGTDTCLCSSDAECKTQGDGNLCNGPLFCNKATQKCALNPAAAVVCPTGLDTVCKKNVCAPSTGACILANAATTTTCDDGDACTVNDYCTDGGCTAGTFICSCSIDSQCVKYHDGNFCAGTMYCNKAKSPAKCELNPATKVVCKTASDTGCSQTLCEPATGLCAAKAVNQFLPCDADGLFCTQGDACLEGVCTAGQNICECLTDGDCAKKDDGDPCNGSLYCDKSKPLFQCSVNPATVVQCPDTGDTCNVGACQKASGKCALLPANGGKVCSDSNVCTAGDQCAGGKCEPLKAVVCDDLNPCTQDSCDPILGCQIAANSTPCDDGNPCSVGDTCKSGQCLAGNGNACDDGKPCTDDFCGAKAACSHAFNAVLCEDGDVCTANDQCAQGQCVAGPPNSCDDNNVCTKDACDVVKGCLYFNADGGPCDSLTCTVGDSCKGGKCVSGGKDKLWSWVDDGEIGGFNGVTVLPNGNLVAVGTRPTDPNFPESVMKLFSPTGQLVGTPNTLSNNRLSAVATRGTTMGIVGDGIVGERDQDGVAKCSNSTVIGQWRGLVEVADGFLLAGISYAGQSNTAYLHFTIQRTSNCKWLWTKEYDSPIAPHRGATGIVANGAGEFLATGWTKDNDKDYQALLVRIDVSGTKLNDAVRGGADSDFANRATHLPGGGWLVSGSTNSKGLGGYDGWLIRVSETLDPVWDRTYGGKADDFLGDVAMTADGGAVAVGNTSSFGATNQQAWLLRLDAWGNVQWSRVIGGAKDDGLQALVVLDDGSLLLAGSHSGSGSARPWLTHTDAWGHETCSSAGKCGLLKANACDDGNPCTADDCDAQIGCTHLKFADQAPCGVGKVCVAGGCQ